MLEQILNDKIKNDTRPEHLRNLYTKKSGKRTTIKSVKVYAGAALKQLLTMPANSGPTTKGVVVPSPLDLDAIGQGQLSDCGGLGCMQAITQDQPNFWNDIFIPQSQNQINVQLWWTEGLIVIQTTTEVSTIYNKSTDAEIRPELWEKCGAFVISGMKDAGDYTNINFRSILDWAYMAGLDPGALTKNVGEIIKARAAGKLVFLQTIVNANPKFISNHYYSVVSYDQVRDLYLCRHPWYGKQIFEFTADEIMNNTVMFCSASFPAVKKIMAPAPTNVVPSVASGRIFNYGDLLAYAEINDGWDEKGKIFFGTKTQINLPVDKGDYVVTITGQSRNINPAPCGVNGQIVNLPSAKGDVVVSVKDATSIKIGGNWSVGFDIFSIKIEGVKIDTIKSAVLTYSSGKVATYNPSSIVIDGKNVTFPE